jgi:hypothetical protein
MAEYLQGYVPCWTPMHVYVIESYNPVLNLLLIYLPTLPRLTVDQLG